MVKQVIKKKYIFLGEVDSINIELIIKSFNILKNKIHYILFCNKSDLVKDIFYKKKRIKINEILDPISFLNYRENMLNIFNIDNISNKKYLNLLNQIKIANNFANITKFDLITMPINKAVFKKNIKFTGMTEYLGHINKSKTIMMMHGDIFSIIPMTTHIELKKVYKSVNSKKINLFFKNLLKFIKKRSNNFQFKEIKFLCHNPHCGEDGTLGKEDILISKIIQRYKEIKGPYSADSIFNKIDKNTLFLSTYHDQALIPFKIINKKSVNITLGLNFNRLSPAHGTAKNIKNKNLADNTSYLKCLLF